MASPRLFLFGDQTVEKVSSIKRLVHASRTSHLLRSFLRGATDVVQIEIAKLASYERQDFFAFDNLVSLAEDNARQDYMGDEVIATTLMCIARLGELITYVESDPTILEPSGPTLHLLGLCTGLLPAAVAAVARDTSDLIQSGLEIVVIAFRLAHELKIRAKHIEDAPGCWSYTILGNTAEQLQEILERFHQANEIPTHRRCYVAVVSDTWTTLFGPPSIFNMLWEFSPKLNVAPKLKLGSGAAVHSSHLPSLGIEWILGQSYKLEAPILPHVQIISTSTGLPYIASDLRQLLYHMIEDISQNVMYLDKTVQSILSDVRTAEDVKLTIVGPTNSASLLEGALQGAGQRVSVIREAQPPLTDHRSRGGSDLIAIIGMSGRFPGSDTIQGFWETLQEGRDFHQKIPKSRFDLETCYDADGAVKNSTTTQYGCFLDQPGHFDSRLFNVSPREAFQMDPIQRLLLMATYEAMEMAGYSQDGALCTDNKRVATYFGQTSDDWRDINDMQGIDIYYIPGVSRAFAPGRLNYHFKWEGPSYSIDSACASSSAAIHLACTALTARDCDTAVAGGGSILASPAIFAGCSRGGFLSPTGGCKTLRDDADGYCRGEGIGVVILKRLEDAVADNDNALAVIRGSAKSYSADAVSITQPHAESQARLYRQTLQRACVDASAIDYVEMHGTGTQAGDLTEIQSITQTLAISRTQDNPLFIGAVKANLGHGEAAAGVHSLIKAVMMLDKSLIPPQPGAPFRINRKFPPLEKMNVIIPASNIPFEKFSKIDAKRRLLINNFDASGGNCCLLVEDPPPKSKKILDTRAYHIIVCSARTQYSLGENKKRLLQYWARLFVSSDADITSKSIVQTQLALIFLELAVTDLWMSWGIRPTLLIGHSLGEYSALCVSGVLSVSDTLYLVAKRAEMMQEKCVAGSHTMLAVGAGPEILQNAIMALGLVSCQLACLNTQLSTVVSGLAEELESLQEHLRARNATSTFLKVRYGFHSTQIEPILPLFAACAKGVPFAKPQIPIASTLTGSVINDKGTFSPDYLVKQAKEPVNFVGTLQALKSDAYVDERTLWVETGPNPVCLGFVRSVLNSPPSKLLPTMKLNEDTWKTISDSLALIYLSFAAISWIEYHREYVDELTLLQLPNYAFDVKDYWCAYKKKELPAPEFVSEVKAPRPKLTTCLQYVEEETSEGDNVSVSFLSYTSDQQLFDVIQGHSIDGTALCPASVFCDMAYTAAKYIYEKARPGENVPDMSLWALEITHALVVPVKTADHFVRVVARKTLEVNWSVHVSFMSTGHGSSHEHGSCQIRFHGDDELKSNSAIILHLVQRRRDALLSSVTAGLSHRLLKPVIYKLFANLMSYKEEYQSLVEVSIDSDYSDALATLKLRPNIDTGDFTCSPYWLDAIIHLAGFLLNGNVTKADDIVYIATGFESLFLHERLSSEVTYTCYAFVQPAKMGNNFVADVYVSQGDRIIAQCARISFQRMTKSVLSTILGNSSPSTSFNVKPQATTATTTSKGQTKRPIENQAQTPSTSNVLGDSSGSEFATDEGSANTSSSQSSLGDQPGSDKAQSLLMTVASETGHEIQDMETSMSFSDMGVDSLMSISIISTAQRQLGMDLPASFFISHPTPRHVRHEFETVAQAPSNDRISKGSSSPAMHQNATPTSEFSTPQVTRDSSLEAAQTKISFLAAAHSSGPQRSTDRLSEWNSDVILVHGRASSTSTPLILIPGGSGSAAAFIHLPPLPAGNRIYALQSPFLKSPLEYTCSIEEISSIFLKAIRKIQPRGPYIIGGWSVGAAHAYEVARQLLEKNEQILGLIIMDMRVPQPLPDVLDTMMELIDRTDMVTGICRAGPPQNPAPKEMKEHLLSNVKALMRYNPTPMGAASRPRYTYLIWAKQGVGETWNDEAAAVGMDATVENRAWCGNVMEDPSTGLEAWFFAQRSSFGSNGWDKLVGDVECHVINANHFSMLDPPHVKTLGLILKKAMERMTTP